MKKKGYRRIVGFLSVISLCLFVFLIFILIYFCKVQNDTKKYIVTGGGVYTQNEMEDIISDAQEDGKRLVLDRIRNNVEEGESLIKVLKDVYPEYIIVPSNGKYHWIEIDDTLKKHPYETKLLNIDEDTGFMTYKSKDSNLVGHIGIDVSAFQKDIDWNAVKADGVEYAYIRGAYRGYGTGRLLIDEKCLENIAAAKEAGIKVGVYVFSQAINIGEAIEEANTILNLIDGIDMDLPIAYDVEMLSNSEARMDYLDITQRTDVTVAFLEEILSHNQPAILYHNMEMGAMYIDLSRLEKYDKWFANYSNEFYWPYNFNVWQYAENGSVDGIDGPVDLDIVFENES